MVFSSITFLFYFLPLVLILYFAAPRFAKNGILLCFSLLFYAWGEPIYVMLMLFSILLNYVFGLAIGLGTASTRNVAMLLGAAANLIILGYFKYAVFLAANLEHALGLKGLTDAIGHLPLPLGISFFTFQAMSYLVDVYRGESPVQRNPFRVALYIALFPQLIAGPIVRYNTICDELGNRTHSISGLGEGLARFIVGLGKKVLIANAVGEVADSAFGLSQGTLSAGAAWIGIACYTLQIYYDFSGYSDMAIGLGRILGFHFPENFRHPYAAASVRDFWRRWHISLSTWFRDYVYIPLGGNRRGEFRTGLNLMLVFLLCGFWHGAAWTFVAWGLFHGCFLALERTRFGYVVDRAPRVLQHAYVIFVFMAGWVLFRASSFDHAAYYFKALVGFGSNAGSVDINQFSIDARTAWIMVFAAIGSFPIWPAMGEFLGRRVPAHGPRAGLRAALTAGLLAILGMSTLQLMSDTYNPFIYFRF